MAASATDSSTVFTGVNVGNYQIISYTSGKWKIHNFSEAASAHCN